MLSGFTLGWVRCRGSGARPAPTSGITGPLRRSRRRPRDAASMCSSTNAAFSQAREQGVQVDNVRRHSCAVGHLGLLHDERVVVMLDQITPGEFTDMAWEGIVGVVDAPRLSKQQIVESEHLMKALVEQKDGLACRVFSKAGIDNTSVLQAADNYF